MFFRNDMLVNPPPVPSPMMQARLNPTVVQQAAVALSPDLLAQSDPMNRPATVTPQQALLPPFLQQIQSSLPTQPQPAIQLAVPQQLVANPQQVVGVPQGQALVPQQNVAQQQPVGANASTVNQIQQYLLTQGRRLNYVPTSGYYQQGPRCF